MRPLPRAENAGIGGVRLLPRAENAGVRGVRPLPSGAQPQVAGIGGFRRRGGGGYRGAAIEGLEVGVNSGRGG